MSYTLPEFLAHAVALEHEAAERYLELADMMFDIQRIVTAPGVGRRTALRAVPMQLAPLQRRDRRLARGRVGLDLQAQLDGVLAVEQFQAVAAGVATGTAMGVAKIIFQWPMLPLLLGAYSVALVCTVLSMEEYVSLAWDSAGVTTGPVTVPLVLALGLGLSKAVGAAEGFGILAMASAGPIISVLAVGLWIRHRSTGEH